MNRAEVLAPAGSFECLEAAIHAGADAVYVGGNLFGARAYANNFDTTELVRAIQYVHLHNRKIYLTVNTLFKNEDVENLYAFLKEPYEAGLDAVIVQDLGVAEYIRKQFPAIDLHASTQMTITNQYGAELIAKMGGTRIVPARELSINELLKIKQVGLEVEVFVHGALCYCYSGQCLLSSMIGGRSGNRGRCAQPCRLPYSFATMDGHQLSQLDSPYILSPKDLCTVDLLSDLLDIGIDSLKIEGRMKNREYVAAVTSAYRHAVDDYYNGKMMEKGSRQRLTAERSQLMEIYNRGGFTQGYWKQHNSKDMMSMQRSNHNGVKVGKIVGLKGGTVQLLLQEAIHVRDILEIRIDNEHCVELTSNQNASIGQKVTLNAQKMKSIHCGLPVYRTRNVSLLNEIHNTIIDKTLKEKVHCTLRIYPDECAKMKLALVNRAIEVEAHGDMVLHAEKQPLQVEQVLDKLCKFGDSEFELDSYELDINEQAFIPMGAIKQLRRQAVALLEKEISHIYERKACEPIRLVRRKILEEGIIPQMSVMVQNREQVEAIIEHEIVSIIYFDMDFINSENVQEYLDYLNYNRRQDISIMVALPRIFRDGAETDILNILKLDIAGILIRNIDELEYIRQKSYNKEIVLDYSCYAYNNETIKYYQSNNLNVWITLPVELSDTELKDLSVDQAEMIVYGYQPVMVSAQCALKNHNQCNKSEQQGKLEDRRNNSFLIQSVCRYCYSIMYNNVPLSLVNYAKDVMRCKAKRIRLSFVNERSSDIHTIINTFEKQYIAGDCEAMCLEGHYTKGHFKRGIE